jgi:phosphosulfolactate synthase
MEPQPQFLDLPDRGAKPRVAGITHVLDKGASPAQIDDLLARVGSFVDLWKLGWGTSYLEPDVPQKVELLARHGVSACVGGTLLEVAWGRGRARECLDWAAAVGFPCVEVSNGAIGMPTSRKRELIAEASARFTVLSEVGSKDPRVEVSPTRWASEMAGDLQAGATWVLTEGRESGSVGLFDPDGEVRAEVAETVAERVGTARVIFEAPRPSQQAWLIRRFGPQVNLGNVAIAEILSAEALRRGLRADTIELSQPKSEFWVPAGGQSGDEV